MGESGDTDESTPKEMQQNPPGPGAEAGDRDDEAGERTQRSGEAAERGGEGARGREGSDGAADGAADFVEEIESDPARATSESPVERLRGG